MCFNREFAIVSLLKRSCKEKFRSLLFNPTKSFLHLVLCTDAVVCGTIKIQSFAPVLITVTPNIITNHQLWSPNIHPQHEPTSQHMPYHFDYSFGLLASICRGSCDSIFRFGSLFSTFFGSFCCGLEGNVSVTLNCTAKWWVRVVASRGDE